MRVLISAIHYPLSAARFLADGFRRLGHSVTTIGAPMGGYLPWQPDTNFSAYAWTPDIQVERDERVSIIADVSGIGGGYDLIVQCDANFFLRGLFQCPNVVWAIDNHVAPYSEAGFDLFFGAHSWGYGSDKENFHWLPCAYDPRAHYQLPDAVKQFDAAMIGHLYPERQALINALAPHGSILVGQGVLGKEYNEWYAAARIAIIKSACGDVAMRVFENAAQGLMLFCDEERDLGKLGLYNGVHYIGYESTECAVSKFQYLKDHPNIVSEIAQAGKEQLARHTYAARAETIIEVCRQGGLL